MFFVSVGSCLGPCDACCGQCGWPDGQMMISQRWRLLRELGTPPDPPMCLGTPRMTQVHNQHWVFVPIFSIPPHLPAPTVAEFKSSVTRQMLKHPSIGIGRQQQMRIAMPAELKACCFIISKQFWQSRCESVSGCDINNAQCVIGSSHRR